MPFCKKVDAKLHSVTTYLTDFNSTILAILGPIDARNIMVTCGLEDYFDVIVISEELGIEKPAKEIFQTALDRLKVKVENTIMVGNRSDADIVGANRIGMKSVWLKWNDRYKETINSEGEKPDFAIKSLPELLGISNST